VTRDLELFSPSEDEQNIWNHTSKSIEKILAFIKNWERECHNSNCGSITKEYAEYKKAPSKADSKVS
jgi:hypothetical protein